MPPSKTLRILGLDPGTSLIGYGIIESHGSAFTPIGYGAIQGAPKIPNRDRVLDVFDRVTSLIQEFHPDLLAIETLFFFKNAKTVIQVSEMRGVLLLAAARQGVEIREFTPLQVKQALSGYGRAEKGQIQAMVKLILALKETPKPDDVADALALAICCANTVRY